MQKCYYDAYNSFRELIVGDLMLLSSKYFALPGGKKLGSGLIGPFQVEKRVGKDAYHLILFDRVFGVYSIFYVSILCPWIARGTSQGPLNPLVHRGSDG